MTTKECVIDANFLAVYLYAEYVIASDGNPDISPQNISRGLAELTQSKFLNATFDDFRRLFGKYDRYYTSSYIIHEVEFIIKRRLKGFFEPYTIFREGAKLFREVRHDVPRISDDYVRFVEVVDLPASLLKWNKSEALDVFEIADMSLLLLAQKLESPILTWDSRLMGFIDGYYYNNIRYENFTSSLGNPAFSGKYRDT